MVQKGKWALNRGNTVVVLDEQDLSKTVRLDNSSLVPSLKQELLQDDSTHVAGSTSGGGVLALLVLAACREDDDAVPVLNRISLDTPAPVEEAPSTALPAEKAPESKVKSELIDGDEHGNNNPEPVQKRKPDWPRAYECLFRILKNSPDISIKTCRLPTNAASALPYMETLVAVAEKTGDLQAVKAALKSLASDWISARTLYPTIAASPAEWMKLSCALESELVYKEAFVHLAGRYPDVETEDLPSGVKEATLHQSREMMVKRYHVTQRLLTTTLKIKLESSGTGKKRVEEKEAVVGQHHAPVAYSTVNVWRDWIAEHISHLDEGNVGDEGSTSTNSTAFCDHPVAVPDHPPECLTVAGFYRTLHRGGDAYLAPEDVLAKWNEGEFNLDQNSVRTNLKILKETAREIVAPLVKSSLQYEKRDTLPYLTCVEAVKAPWVGARGDEDSEDEDEDDMEVD